MAEWGPAQIQEWNVEAQHLMPLQPPLVPELSHMREAQLHTAEASLWSVVATVQAMERKIDLLATRLLSLEGRSGNAEKKLLDCEKTAMEFGNQLESKWAVLGTLIQEYGLLQRRLENMENLLKNRNFWVLRLPPGAKGEIPKMPVTFVDIAVYFSAEEWKNLAEWQKGLYNNLVKENYESLLSLGAEVNVSKAEPHPRIERGAETCIPEQQNAKEREIATDPCTEPLMSTPDILTRIKQEEPFAGGGQFPQERGIPADPCAGAEALMSAHDFLSWIKQEEEPCVREHWEPAERDILTGPGTAGDGMAVKTEEQRPCPCPEGAARPREAVFQGAGPGAAVGPYVGQCGPVPQPLSPARSRPDKAVSKLPYTLPWIESQEELSAVGQEVSMKIELPLASRRDVETTIKTEQQDLNEGHTELGQILRPAMRECTDQSRAHVLQGNPPEAPLQPGLSESVGLKSTLGCDGKSHRARMPQNGTEGHTIPALEPQLTSQETRFHCEDVTPVASQEQLSHRCSDCGEAFQQGQDLATHRSTHSRVKEHQCAHCGQCFFHRSRLNYHSRTHTGERPYSCSQCGKSFSRKEHLRNHQRTHAGDGAFQGDVAIVVKVQDEGLNNHHEGLEQILGPRPKDSSEQLGMKAQEEHVAGDPLRWGARVPTEQTPTHRCDGEPHRASTPPRCNESGMNAVAEQQSTSRKRPLCEAEEAEAEAEAEEAEEEESTSGAAQGQHSHTCEDCGEAFQRWQELAAHQSRHGRVKQHQCPHCGQRFLHRSRLNYHSRIHTGERPYLCTVCGKNYSRKEHLQNHQRLHTGEKPYQCEECGKSYSRREHLQYHQRLHTGERPFQCPACGKRFIRKQNLLKHQRVHTGERHKAGLASSARSPPWTA
ncbi:zinc finger protein 282-like [Elgaria multicarinata webbii]|uniref:zinc finger protein 282-like n=1 Tax=Elgaria multicarinata webbii TaxID=159646 RepID=UPI002FCD3AB2